MTFGKWEQYTGIKPASTFHKLRILWQHPRYWRSILACKYGEPLHEHHDGCPACTMPSEAEMDAIAEYYKEGA